MFDMKFRFSEIDRGQILDNIEVGIRKAFKQMPKKYLTAYNKSVKNCAVTAMRAELGQVRFGFPSYGLLTGYLSDNISSLITYDTKNFKYTSRGILHTATFKMTEANDKAHASAYMLDKGQTRMRPNINAIIKWIDDRKGAGTWSWNVRNGNKTSKQQAFSIFYAYNIGGKLPNWTNVFDGRSHSGKAFTNCVKKRQYYHMNKIKNNFYK